MELFKENMPAQEVKQFPTLTLAHIGDCVYELLARSHVIHEGAFKAAETHRRTVALVSAEYSGDGFCHGGLFGNHKSHFVNPPFCLCLVGIL